MTSTGLPNRGTLRTDALLLSLLNTSDKPLLSVWSSSDKNVLKKFVPLMVEIGVVYTKLTKTA